MKLPSDYKSEYGFQIVDPMPNTFTYVSLSDAITEAYRKAILSKRIIEIRYSGELIITVFPQTSFPLG